MMKDISLQITDMQYEALMELSHLDNISLSELVRSILDDVLFPIEYFGHANLSTEKGITNGRDESESGKGSSPV